MAHRPWCSLKPNPLVEWANTMPFLLLLFFTLFKNWWNKSSGVEKSVSVPVFWWTDSLFFFCASCALMWGDLRSLAKNCDELTFLSLSFYRSRAFQFLLLSSFITSSLNRGPWLSPEPLLAGKQTVSIQYAVRCCHQTGSRKQLLLCELKVVAISRLSLNRYRLRESLVQETQGNLWRLVGLR